MQNKKLVIGGIVLGIIAILAVGVGYSTSAAGKYKIDLPGFQEIPASAADTTPTWYHCVVTRVGPGWGNNYIALTDLDGAFTNRWFLVRSGQEDEMLDAALTAISNDIYVVVSLGSPDQYTELLAFYLVTVQP